ncbi:hypothetical protein [Paenibacillus endophyticus]|uniref:hypothetical protein n=1 Tax=Paenibacillus endophyticus TaxID=1294268 RepID=UPI0035E41FE3
MFASTVSIPLFTAYSIFCSISRKIGIEPSRAQTRDEVSNGAISMNGEKISDLEFGVSCEIVLIYHITFSD